jgi:hypothetical protein
MGLIGDELGGRVDVWRTCDDEAVGVGLGVEEHGVHLLAVALELAHHLRDYWVQKDKCKISGGWCNASTLDGVVQPFVPSNLTATSSDMGSLNYGKSVPTCAVLRL